MKKYLWNERGLSLVEVVASLIIITLILVSFFGLLVQSKKAGVSSENTVDATYLAQQTMEEMYSFVKVSTSIDTLITNTNLNANYTVVAPDPPSNEYTLTNKENDLIAVKIKNFTEDGNQNLNLVSVKTEVKHPDEKASPVIMETIWLWGK